MQTTDEGSSQSESSDNTLYVLDELRGQKSHEKGNASQTSTMQSMYILLLLHSYLFFRQKKFRLGIQQVQFKFSSPATHHRFTDSVISSDLE